jgi:iron(III) transport system permease protein
MAAIPWVAILSGIGLRTVEPELEEAALVDLPAWRVVAFVSLRRAAGAIAGAALVVAVLTAGDMTVTDLVQVRTYAEEAYNQYQLGRGAAAAAGVALPPLLVFGALVGVAGWGLMRTDPARLASAADLGRVWQLGRWRFPVGLGAGAAVGCLVGLPLFALIWRAGRVGGSAALGQRPSWSVPGLAGTLGSAVFELAGIPSQAEPGAPSGLAIPPIGALLSGPLATSLLWSTLAATLTVLIAWTLAWVCLRPGPWRFVAGSSVALGLAVPGPVAGMALVLAYRDIPLVYDSPAMLVLAAVVRTLPFCWLVAWPAIRALPPEFLETAALDGLDSCQIAWRVAVPSTRAAIAAAWGVGFVLALGELPATYLVTPPGTVPITVVIWGLLHTGVESHLAGVVLVMLAIVASAGVFAATALSAIRPLTSSAVRP